MDRRHRSVRLAAALGAILAILASRPANTWEEETTHVALAGYPLRSSARFQDFLGDTGLGRFAFPEAGNGGETKRITDLMQELDKADPAPDIEGTLLNANIRAPYTARQVAQIGCANEDTIRTARGGPSLVKENRALSHFYDPKASADGRDPAISGFKGEAVMRALGNPIYSAPRWASGRDAVIGARNDHDYVDLIEYFRQSFTSPERPVRRSNLFNGFLTVGHLNHLVEDLLQPSHSRNDPHPRALNDPSPLEVWGERELRPERFAHDKLVQDVPPRFSNSLEQYFSNGALVSHTYFFSEDTIAWDRKKYLGPNPAQTNWASVSAGIGFPGAWIRVNGFARLAVKAEDLDELRPLAFPRLVAVYNAVTHFRETGNLAPVSVTELYAFDKDALPTAESLEFAYTAQLVPRSVGHDRGLLDFIFRGRFGEVPQLRPGATETVPVRNASVVAPPKERPNSDDLTWSGGIVRLSWIVPVANEVTLTLAREISVGKWAPGQGQDVELVVPGNATGLVLWYSGTIGAEQGFAARVVSFPPIGALPPRVD